MALLRYKNKQGQVKPFTSIVVQEAPDIEIDNELSTESTNPVENRVITVEVNDKLDKEDVRAITNIELEALLQ